MGKDYVVTDCIEHPEKNRCVDIIQQRDGKYRFQEWRRDNEDTTGWILLLDSQPVVFDSEAAATSAAQLRCIWLERLEWFRLLCPVFVAVANANFD